MTLKHVPKVGVLLATFNGSCHIRDQLASIAWQTGVDVTLLVRDDCSTDCTMDIVREFQSQRALDIVILDDNHGRTGSAAHNFFLMFEGLNIGDFDYVAFSDQDDVWFPSKLRSAIDLLVARSAECYSCNLLAYDGSSGESWIIEKAGQQKALDYLFQGASAGCTYVMTRRAAACVQGSLSAVAGSIPPDVSHDWTVYAICRSHQLAWIFDSQSNLMYRQHGANQYGALPGLAGLLSRLKMTRQKWYGKNILWLRAVLTMTAAERQVLDAVARLSLRDRLWLASQAFRFRRTSRDALLLAVTIIVFGL
jgi:rhamnosyltransferase